MTGGPRGARDPSDRAVDGGRSVTSKEAILSALRRCTTLTPDPAQRKISMRIGFSSSTLALNTPS